MVFEHNVRRMVYRYTEVGQEQVYMKLKQLSFDLEQISLDLGLRAENMDVYAHNIALQEEQRMVRLLKSAEEKLARRDFAGCDNDATDVVCGPGTMLVHRCLARLLLAQLPSRPLAERRRFLTTGNTLMKVLFQGKTDPALAATYRRWAADVVAVSATLDALEVRGIP